MRTIKLVIIGDSGVGKTSFRTQYVSGKFSTAYRSTIGTDFITKTLPHYQNHGEMVTLQIWDTAGQERFSALSSAYFRGADAALLMFDINQPETLHGLKKWWDEFKAHAPVPDEEAGDFCCVVVGNKIDLAQTDLHSGEEGNEEAVASSSRGSGRKVSEADAELFLEELIPYSNTSVWPDIEEEDPFVENPIDVVLSDRHAGLYSRPISEFSLRTVRMDNEDIREAEAEAPDRTRSISIQGWNSPIKRVDKSRSSERSLFGGTVTTARTMQTIYHTPSSSLFDSFESAPSSPFHESMDLPSSYSVGPSPPVTAERHILRKQPSSSSSSAPTITPSLFIREQASSSAAPTPPTPSDINEFTQSDFPFSSRSHRLPPRPERRPRLFLASAKTGVGVEPIFEYIARRVAMRWTYAEALEDRATCSHGIMDNTVQLTTSKTRAASLRERWAAGKGSCCGA